MDYNEVLETKSLITKLIRIWRTWSEASENTSLTMAAETSMIWLVVNVLRVSIAPHERSLDTLEFNSSSQTHGY